MTDAGTDDADDLATRRQRLADRGYRIELRDGATGDRAEGGTLAVVVTPEGTELPAGSRDDRDDAVRAALVIAETDAAQPRK